jgi:anti-sigma factor ChrR (cupin superfamily)
MNGNGRETDYHQELTALYALGALGQHEARALEALLEEDERLAAELRAFESVVAALGLDAPEAAPPAEAREKLMARLAEEKRPASIARYATTSPAMNAALRGIFHVRADEGEWVPHSPGIEAKILFEDKSSGSLSTLLRMKPGAEVIRHRHFGLEECLVLEGDFHIGDETYGPGDFQCALPGSVHEKVYTDGGALVLIISGGFEPLS